MKFILNLILVCAISFPALAQTFPSRLGAGPSWTAKELMDPAVLASRLKSNKGGPIYIFNIGVVENIQGAKNVGAASDAEGLKKLKQSLSSIPKDKEVIIYCGCCPFDKCPNIRPAFNLMKSMGFKNGKLLNLPVNLQQNWKSRGYPMAKN